MQRMFSAFPDIIFVDATYKLNAMRMSLNVMIHILLLICCMLISVIVLRLYDAVQWIWRMPLYVMMVEDSLGQSEVAVVCLLNSDEKPIIELFVRCFKESKY
jgi:hypothetical protein